tara:strand:- start:711 stop:1331 length:621 start_codon:yes stop_codon:yes gene_type:complete
MAYFLGSDVEVCITTECHANSIEVDVASGNYAVSGAAGVDVTYGVNRRQAANAVFADDALVDIVGVDIGIGAMDEDIDYLGHNTPLKAEVRKNTTVTLTFKRKNLVFDALYIGDKDGNIGRWGPVSGSTANVNTGLEEPTVDYGYRLYIKLKGSNEIFTIRNCQMTANNITLNADGTQEQSLEFTSMVQPKIAATVDVTATGVGEL